MLRQLIDDAVTRFADISSVGLGIPGTLSPTTGLVKNANSTWLIGHPLGADLRKTVSLPINIANDADCFALSEAIDGAGQDAKSVWGIILGTGVGSGIVINGALLSGPNAITGEWGHNPLPHPTKSEMPGDECYCGKFGCIETFLSGPSLLRDHHKHNGAHTSPKDIAKAATAGNVQAKATLNRYTERLARATASVINILDPEVIVLGGGLSQLSTLYQDIPKLWPRYVFSDTVATMIRPPRHGDSSGVRGAAWLGRTHSPQSKHTE